MSMPTGCDDNMVSPCLGTIIESHLPVMYIMTTWCLHTPAAREVTHKPLSLALVGLKIPIELCFQST